MANKPAVADHPLTTVRGFSAARHELRMREAAERRDAEHYEMIRTAPPEDGLCYFVGFDDADGGGLVKIGYTRNLPQRLRRLRAGSLYKLTVLATCHGAYEAESYYHRKFFAHAVGGEWFRRCPEIEAEIARLNDPGYRCRRTVA